MDLPKPREGRWWSDSHSQLSTGLPWAYEITAIYFLWPNLSRQDAMSRVLGIDPGLNVTGYAVLEVARGGPKLCEAGVVRGRTKSSLTARVAEIHEGIAEVLATLKPTVVSLEQLYSHYKQPRTAILMGHARGVICLAAAQAGVPVVSYNATQVKKSLTGNGHAGKRQMQLAVQRELRLTALPEPHDVGDALAIALCHYYRQPDWAALARRA